MSVKPSYLSQLGRTRAKQSANDLGIVHLRPSQRTPLAIQFGSPSEREEISREIDFSSEEQKRQVNQKKMGWKG